MFSKPKKTASFPYLWHKSILKKQADQEKKRVAVLLQVKEAMNSLEKKYQWDEAYYKKERHKMEPKGCLLKLKVSGLPC